MGKKTINLLKGSFLTVYLQAKIFLTIADERFIA